MGNKLSSSSRRKQRVEEQYTRPHGLYPKAEVDVKKLRRLILDGKLAPCYPGVEEVTSESSDCVLEECPICFLNYPGLNRSSCCGKSICTECFIQIKAPPTGVRTQCPFCKTSGYTVKYHVKTFQERQKEKAEQEKVLQAQIRAREQEEREDRERRLSRTIESENSTAQGEEAVNEYGVTPEQYERIMGGSIDDAMRTRSRSSSSQRSLYSVSRVRETNGISRRIGFEEESRRALHDTGDREGASDSASSSQERDPNHWLQGMDSRTLHQFADHLPPELLSHAQGTSLSGVMDVVDLEEILLAQAVLHSLEDMEGSHAQRGNTQETLENTELESRPSETQFTVEVTENDVVSSDEGVTEAVERLDVEALDSPLISESRNDDSVSNAEDVPPLSSFDSASTDATEVAHEEVELEAGEECNVGGEHAPESPEIENDVDDSAERESPEHPNEQHDEQIPLSSESDEDDLNTGENNLPESATTYVGQSSGAIGKSDTFPDAVVSQQDLPLFEAARGEAIA